VVLIASAIFYFYDMQVAPASTPYARLTTCRRAWLLRTSQGEASNGAYIFTRNVVSKNRLWLVNSGLEL
jgi:hypothetical protein